MDLPELTLRDIDLRCAVVPMARPLATRVISIEEMAFLLIDLHTHEGVTGRAYLWGFTVKGCGYLAAIVRDLAAAASGAPLVPVDLYNRFLKAMTMFGHEGLSLSAISGLDMACWDALGRAAETPLAVLLDGETGPIKAYNSNGLGLTDDLGKLAEEACELVAEGDFAAVKVRLGRNTLEDDLAAFRAVRAAVGEATALPVDFNQGLDRAEALHRGRALEAEDVYWIEEPVVYDDLDGAAELAAALETPVQLGENFYGPKAVTAALDAEACDYIMPDLQRIGGVTGWRCAAAIAAEAGIPMSSHIFPEASAQVMAVTPTRHWLEYTNWAAPILENPLEVRDGHVIVPDRPGIGIDWNEAAVRRFQVDL